jgi:hypothetical protein
MVRKFICPACKQRTGVDIVYGIPGPDIADQAERGEIVLGGCVIGPDSPERACKQCHHEWRITRRPPPPGIVPL